MLCYIAVSGCCLLQRGWTSWCLGAVDKRVIGIIPVVMDELSLHSVRYEVFADAHAHVLWCDCLVQNLHHHYRSLGGWTFAFADFHDLNITAHLDDAAFEDMAAIVDPRC